MATNSRKKDQQLVILHIDIGIKTIVESGDRVRAEDYFGILEKDFKKQLPNVVLLITPNQTIDNVNIKCVYPLYITTKELEDVIPPLKLIEELRDKVLG